MIRPSAAEQGNATSERCRIGDSAGLQNVLSLHLGWIHPVGRPFSHGIDCPPLIRGQPFVDSLSCCCPGPKNIAPHSNDFVLAGLAHLLPDAILYPPPHIPSGSEQNPTESHQIPTIFLPRNKKSVPISFRVIPSSFRVHSESFRPTYGFKKKTFLPSQNAKFRPNSDQIPSQFWVHSESIPTKFRPNSDQILGLF